MSQYPPPAPYPPPYWMPPAAKRRPKAMWWIGGGLLGLALIALAVLLTAFVHEVHAVTDSSAHPAYLADGADHTLDLSPHTREALFTDTVETCEVTDGVTGAYLPLDQLNRSYGSDTAGDEYEFTAGSGPVVITCQGQEGSWWVVSRGTLIATGITFVALIVVPGLLGVAGLTVLIIALVLTVSRPKQPVWRAT